MNELATIIALDPEPVGGPFMHRVVRREHPILNDFRYSCLCGWRSGWFECGVRGPAECLIEHPDGVVTRSRTDLVRIPHPSNRGGTR